MALIQGGHSSGFLSELDVDDVLLQFPGLYVSLGDGLVELRASAMQALGWGMKKQREKEKRG